MIELKVQEKWVSSKPLSRWRGGRFAWRTEAARPRKKPPACSARNMEVASMRALQAPTRPPYLSSKSVRKYQNTIQNA
jgi:hypothetical protein